jgi:hypothetical protein
MARRLANVLAISSISDPPPPLVWAGSTGPMPLTLPVLPRSVPYMLPLLVLPLLLELDVLVVLIASGAGRFALRRCAFASAAANDPASPSPPRDRGPFGIGGGGGGGPPMQGPLPAGDMDITGAGGGGGGGCGDEFVL